MVAIVNCIPLVKIIKLLKNIPKKLVEINKDKNIEMKEKHSRIIKSENIFLRYPV